MTWFKIDDGFTNSKPVMKLPRRVRSSAIGLWTLAGAWSAKELTDGDIPEYLLEEFASSPAIAAHLVACGLWEKADNGWSFVGWAKYQYTREQVMDKRKEETERKRVYRESRKRPNGTTAGQSSGHQRESAPPVPSRPVPSVVPNGTTNTGSLREPAAAKRGTRLPQNWQPSPDLLAQMRQECPGVDLRAQHRVFTDHWAAQPGQRAVKTDWDATWRNWMRRSDTSTSPAPRRSTTDAGIAAIQAMKHPQRLEIA